jgi:YD repeat-containing protein
VYTYDNAGNRLSKKGYRIAAEGAEPTSLRSTYTYGYSTGAWGDILTSYDGSALTYDEIGNPLTYNNGASHTFTWNGRQLMGAVRIATTYSFTYNDEGIRTSKTKNGVTTTYYLDGTRILGEETSGNLTLYVYDAEGMPLGMQYRAASYAADEWDERIAEVIKARFLITNF